MGKYHKKVRDFSSETLLAILNDVRSKRISLRTAASSLKVSVNFIRDRVTGKISVDQAETRGRKTVLKSEEEEELADYLRILAKWGHGFLRKETILIVGEFCESNNRVTPFKSGIPGKDWYAGFSKRHNLKLGNTEQLEKCRLKNTANPFMVYPFYDMLESEARALDIVNKPEHFWNLDEIGASKDPTKAKIVAGAEQSNLFCTIQGSGKDNVTVMGCISASGTALPPMFIFKAQNLWSTWRGQSDIPGTFYAVSDKGFINSDIFFEYFKKFVVSVKVRPIILIYDGHISHMTLKVVKLAQQERISILKLPSHTTDVMQPLDRTCFGPLKVRLNETLLIWQRANQRQPSKSEFVDLLCSVWFEGLSPLNIISGFRGCGIFPINRDKYPIKRLNPELLKQYLEEREKKNSEQTIGAIAETSEASTSQVTDQEDALILSPPIELEVIADVEIQSQPDVIEHELAGLYVEVPDTTDLDTGNTLDPDFIVLSDDNLDCDKEMADHTAEVSRQVNRPSRTIKRPLKLADTPQVPRQRKKAKSSGGRREMFTVQDSTRNELLVPGPSGIARPNNGSSTLSLPPSNLKSKTLSGFSGTKAVDIQTSEGSNEIEATKETFESLFLKKIGSTKPVNETRRLVHANAAVITSDEYAQKIEELTKKTPPPKTKSKRTPAKIKQPRKKRAPKPAAKSSQDKENVIPASEPNENVGENDYALCKESNGENTICFIEKVMPNLEEAVALRFVKVSSESSAFKIDGPCLLKISHVVKNAGKPVIVPTPSGIHYVFESLN